MTQETIPKRQRQEGESDTNTPLNKKPRLNNTPTTSRPPSLDSYFDVMPQEVMINIVSFLPEKAKNQLALTSHIAYQSSRQALIDTDFRQLKSKTWADGPPQDSFENYLFNNVIWRIGSCLLEIKNDLKFQTLSIPNMGPLLKSYSYLESHFGNFKSTHAILEAIHHPRRFLGSKNEAIMTEHALLHPESGEADFIPLMHYLANDTYTLPEQVSHPMGILERYFRTKEARLQLDKEGHNPDQIAALWEMILTYDLDRRNSYEHGEAATAHFNAGCATSDSEKRFKHFERAIHLLDLIFDNIRFEKEFHEQSLNASLRCEIARECHDSKQKLAILLRATEIYEQMFQEEEYEDDEEDLSNAGEAYFLVGTLHYDPAQKQASFIRSAQLRDTLLHTKSNPINTDDIENAITSYHHVSEHTVTPDIKQMCFERIQELRTWQEMLKNNTLSN